MTNVQAIFRGAVAFALLSGLTSSAFAQVSGSGTSELVTWVCTSSPCPWGPADSGQALVWPAAAGATSLRHGYTTTSPVYLPAARANGTVVQITSGSATLYAGTPGQSSHYAIVTLSAGTAYEVSGLASDEMLSVQSGGLFGYSVFVPPAPLPEVPPAGTASQLITWTCTGSPCPWGPTDSGHALVWPAGAGPLSNRHGYTASQPVYLPASRANGATVEITLGFATLYAGTPNSGSHRVLTTLSTGNSYVVGGLGPDEVLSVQASTGFHYQIVLPPPPPAWPVSELVTWNCTSSPCPWGVTSTGQALVWPAEAYAQSSRHGYTTSKAVYLPASVANGTQVTIKGGTATLYAGFPSASSHRVVAVLTVASGTYTVAGLASGEVLSVQGALAFNYETVVPPAPPPPPPITSPASTLVTWNCTSSPCPWGSSTSNHALVWPTSAGAASSRFGYTTSQPVYLPWTRANGATVTIKSGSATLYAGLPNAGWHRVVATLEVNDSYAVSGLASGETLSVQSGSSFHYEITLPPAPPPPPPGTVYDSVSAHWRCDEPGCTSPDWIGSVVNWPSWAAYPNNNRDGDFARRVYSDSGSLLYPYMGAWADGCEVTALSGVVLIIEWERGTNEWRETVMDPGDVYVIDLHAPEDGAMIETTDAYAGPFSVSLRNCTPQAL